MGEARPGTRQRSTSTVKPATTPEPAPAAPPDEQRLQDLLAAVHHAKVTAEAPLIVKLQDLLGQPRPDPPIPPSPYPNDPRWHLQVTPQTPTSNGRAEWATTIPVPPPAPPLQPRPFVNVPQDFLMRMLAGK